MTHTGPGRAIREGQQAPPGPPPRVNPMPLSALPPGTTPREAALHLSYAQAVAAAESVLDEIKAKGLQRPYPEGMRMTLRTCAEVFLKAASP